MLCIRCYFPNLFVCVLCIWCYFSNFFLCVFCIIYLASNQYNRPKQVRIDVMSIALNLSFLPHTYSTKGTTEYRNRITFLYWEVQLLLGRDVNEGHVCGERNSPCMTNYTFQSGPALSVLVQLSPIRAGTGFFYSWLFKYTHQQTAGFTENSIGPLTS